MIASEEQTLSLLKNDIINWKRYVNDTYAYIKPNKVTNVLNIEFLPPNNPVHI